MQRRAGDRSTSTSTSTSSAGWLNAAGAATPGAIGKLCNDEQNASEDREAFQFQSLATLRLLSIARLQAGSPP